MKIGIFTTFQGNYLTDSAVAACRDLGVDCEVVDILSSDSLNLMSGMEIILQEVDLNLP